MNNNEQTSNNPALKENIDAEHDRHPRRKRVYHTWWFWIFLVLMLGAILYYVISVDFVFAP